MSRKTVFLLAILILGALLRFLWLDRVPHSINGDELHYILSAKSFALSGKDITQTASLFDILRFHYPPNEVVQAELPYVLDMITVGFFPFSLAAIALPSSMLSFLLIFLMYGITKKLFNDQTALVAAFLTAINPWFIAAGRTSYEMVSATFFYMLAFYILLVARGWRILLAFPVFLLAFYTYIATKLIFLPVLVVFSAFCFFAVHKKKYLKQYLTLIGLGVIFVGFFLFQLHSGKESRVSEILTPSYPLIANKVDMLRKATMNSPLLAPFDNKITVFSDIILNNIFEVFSFKYLFFQGDYFFALGRHGLLYMLDPVFLFIGAALLFINKKKHFWFLITMSAVAVLPQIVHSSSIKNGNFSPHTTMLLPFLIMLIAVGIWETIASVRKKRTVIGIAIIGVYVLLLGNFFNIYFFSLPLQHNFYNLPNRLLSQYITLAKPEDYKITIYTTDPRGKFQEYLFYSNTYNKNTLQNVTAALHNKKYVMGNVSFVSCDNKITEFDPKNVTVFHLECGMTTKQDLRSIPDLSDSGAVFKIVHDRLCDKYTLKPYVSGFTINDFAIDRLSPQQFCSTYVMGR